MKSEREIESEIRQIENNTIDTICQSLANYSDNLCDYLATFVAKICKVSNKEMFSETKNLDIVRARWLYWYAYRYMTDATYETIALHNNCKENKKFTRVAVNQGVSRMALLISEEDTIWAKRWNIIRRVIKAMLKQNDAKEFAPQTILLKVTHPKGVTLEIKTEEK